MDKMFKFYVKVVYVRGKALLGKLSCTRTGLVILPVTSRKQDVGITCTFIVSAAAEFSCIDMAGVMKIWSDLNQEVESLKQLLVFVLAYTGCLKKKCGPFLKPP